MQEIGIDSKLVDDIRNYQKTIEARLGKPKFLKINIGDKLSVREDYYLNGELIDSFNNSLIVKVTQILYFESFDEMFNSIDYKSAVPQAKNIEQAKSIYREFYSKSDEMEFGVVAMYIEPVE